MRVPKDILAELHKQKFIRTRRAAHVIIYSQVDNSRWIDVQIWADGRHRVSHFLRGVTNTVPTDFVDVEGMRTAIEHERTRTDHPASEFRPPTLGKGHCDE